MTYALGQGCHRLKEDSIRYKKPNPTGPNKINEVTSITPTNPLNLSNNQPRRNYTDLGMPITLVFQEAVKAGYLKPLEARPPPNPLPLNYKTNEYCEFHQGNGHKTEACWTLKKWIQDLVDNGSIISKTKPNINTNPLPNHGVNSIATREELFDPLKLFLEMNNICVLDLNDLSEEVNVISRNGRQHEPIILDKVPN